MYLQADSILLSVGFQMPLICSLKGPGFCFRCFFAALFLLIFSYVYTFVLEF